MKNRKLFFSITAVLSLLLLGIFSLFANTSPAQALTTAPVTVVEDFEDGDSSDWGFFGGNGAGGGGGLETDRPKEGVYYLSTGWGGGGSASGFYGGAFKNFVDAAQITPPADPWFNVWVLNQSNATVDQFTLEITLREDLDGNGWSNGSEDSFRLDTTFVNTSFNDQWTLISAPLSSFSDLFTGGDGVFNGDLDEIVVVVAGVVGGDGSTVELDFDQFSFTSNAPAPDIFDDMEHGDPFANGWFAFGGSVGGGGIGAEPADLPPVDGGVFSLGTGWGSGGVPGFFGGFGRTNPTDLTNRDTFNFWINPNADQDYTLEINLQDDDNGDNAIVNADDDEFQYNCVVSPTGPCAISGGGWQQIAIPLADFFPDNSFVTGGNDVLDASPVSSGGNGQLINIIFAVISNSGADVNFRTDYWAFSTVPTKIVEDFENGLPAGVDGDGVNVGFHTFNGPGDVISIATTDTPPAPVPASAAGNNVIAATADVSAYAGFIHSFTNETADAWLTQDWSRFEGISFWLYGNNSGTALFIDILDNRNPGSTSDDAERFRFDFTDDFSGWKYFEIPFSSFRHFEVGNGAPNDGLNLTDMHGWALGMLGTPGEITFYMDDFGLYGVTEISELLVNFEGSIFEVTEGETAEVTVKLTRELGLAPDDPSEVSVNYSTEEGSAVAGRDFTQVSGTLTFVSGGPKSQTIFVPTFDNPKNDGDKSVILRLSSPTDVLLGVGVQAVVTIEDDEPLDPTLIDDFEYGSYLWSADDALTLSTPEIDTFEHALQVDSQVEVVVEGSVCNKGKGVIPVAVLTTDSFDALTLDHTTVRLGDAYEIHQKGKDGELTRHEEDFDGDGDIDLVFHFRANETGYTCASTDVALYGTSLERDFAIGQDWSKGESLSFWFYGNDSGEEFVVNLKDNRAADPGPSGWNMVWSEEFNEAAGTPPNPEYWSYEIGDGAINSIPGWGNSELQYYTSSTENSATDGSGNLVITAKEASGEPCYYGDCEYTSARLISQYKAEFAYGRIESRIQVPDGDDGLWPAFWSLGTDIGDVYWPQTGEIDFMEYVSRLPNEIFGTIHGPGYSGGASFGNIYDFGEPVSNNYHTFAVEWEPDVIRWYVDGILYHTATPADVAPNQWVFNDPVFLILNMAVGGNFGGPVSDTTTFPQEMKVDYVRVFQGPDTAERFEASFVDNFSGWQQVVVPFADFTRSANQPAGAPDDGLSLSEVWGYGFEMPYGDYNLMLDQVRLELIPPPTSIVVTNLNDSGAGSLREALDRIATDGLITFDPVLTDGTIGLASGQLVIDRSVTIDGSGAPGLTVSGGNTSRVFQVSAGKTVSMNDLTISDGAGAPQGGGILNYGTLNLDYVTVSNNTESSGGGASFELGGGGIYNGDSAVLNLTNSSVSNNNTIGQPGGGIYGFFNSTINVINSTVSGNVAGDVAGGLRTLGNANIINSTISGNTSTAWHGGAMFSTDGTVTILNSTIVNNNAPDGTSGGLMVATFGAPVLVTVQNSIIADNSTYSCQVEGSPAVAVLTSLGNNVFTDGSCGAIGSDQVVVNTGLALLADNGGPTLTHALLAGSPALDAADGVSCPATDQRGVVRPQGDGCDIGAFELQAP